VTVDVLDRLFRAFVPVSSASRRGLFISAFSFTRVAALQRNWMRFAALIARAFL
jgi:hypothetical protein